MKGMASARDTENCGQLVQDCVNARTVTISADRGVIAPPSDKSGRDRPTIRKTPPDIPSYRCRPIGNVGKQGGVVRGALRSP